MMRFLSRRTPLNLRLCKKQIEMWCGLEAEGDRSEREMGLEVAELNCIALLARCDVRLKRWRMAAQLACGGTEGSPSHLRKLLQFFGYIFWLAQREAGSHTHTGTRERPFR